MVVQNQATVTEAVELARKFRADPKLLDAALLELETLDAERKFATAKALRLLSEQAPGTLYPHFDRFVALLECGNGFLRWDATRILAALATVDKHARIEAILDPYLKPVRGPHLIGAAATITGAARIALAKPQLANQMSHAILRVERAHYQTEECRNIAIGRAIEALDQFFHLIGDPHWVIAFVRRQTGNRRPATRKKAEQFLKRRNAMASAVASGR